MDILSNHFSQRVEGKLIPSPLPPGRNLGRFLVDSGGSLLVVVGRYPTAKTVPLRYPSHS